MTSRYARLKNMRKIPVKKKTSRQELMRKILSSPRYKGKHVIVVNDKIFVAKTGAGASKILADIDRKYPDATPAITYVPDADALILWL